MPEKGFIRSTYWPPETPDMTDAQRGLLAEGRHWDGVAYDTWWDYHSAIGAWLWHNARAKSYEALHFLLPEDTTVLRAWEDTRKRAAQAKAFYILDSSTGLADPPRRW